MRIIYDKRIYWKAVICSSFIVCLSLYLMFYIDLKFIIQNHEEEVESETSLKKESELETQIEILPK